MKRLNRELPVNPHQRPWRAKHRKIGQPEGHWTRSYGISRDASSSAKRANQAPTPCRCARRSTRCSGLSVWHAARPGRTTASTAMPRALAAPIGHLLGGSMKQSSPCNKVDATGADSGGALALSCARRAGTRETPCQKRRRFPGPIRRPARLDRSRARHWRTSVPVRRPASACGSGQRERRASAGRRQHCAGGHGPRRRWPGA